MSRGAPAAGMHVHAEQSFLIAPFLPVVVRKNHMPRPTHSRSSTHISIVIYKARLSVVVKVLLMDYKG